MTIECPRTPTGAEGYVSLLLSKSRTACSGGQHGTDGQPSSLTLTGQIHPDGSAAINARGLTGDPKYAVNREAQGTPYGYRATARFEGDRGTGKKTDIRPCDLTFAKQ